MRAVDEIFSLRRVVGQQNGNQSFGTVQPSPEHVVFSPGFIEERTEGHQCASGQFLAFCTGALFHNQWRVFGAYPINVDDIGFAGVGSVLNRIRDQIVDKEILVVVIEAEPRGIGSCCCIRVIRMGDCQPG